MSLSPLERVLLQRRLQRRRGGGQGALIMLLAALVLAPAVVLGLGALGAGVAYASLAGELEEGLERIGNVEERQLFETTRIYDRNGILLRQVFNEGRRTYVPLSEIPDIVRQATIAVEDKNFYENPGIEPTGIVRALLGEVLSESGAGGGSTITQQFVRHVAFSYEERVARSYRRKAKEIALSVVLTRRHTKDEILEWYLNEIYYGNLAYGIEAAARTVFDKPARELDLAEAALLAGLPQMPYVLDPQNPDPDVQAAVKYRQRTVLDLMVENGFITRVEADAAAARDLEFHDQDDDLFLAPHFVVWVQDLLEERLGAERLARGGLEVTTSLDLSLQALGERVVREHVEELVERHDLTNAALVAMEPRTGQVLAMVGSADYWDDDIDGRVNVALRERQPGSSIKPITYITALERGLPTSTMLWDVKVEYELPGQAEPYEPGNYDEEFHGPVRLRGALANSYNIPALKLIETIPPVTPEEGAAFDAYLAALEPNYPGGRYPDGNTVEALTGVELTVATAHRMGITGLNLNPWHYGLSLTLGGGDVKLLDMTTAFGTMANGGELVRPNPVLRVIDSAGAVIYDLAEDAPALEPVPAADPRAVHIVTDILSDNEARTPAFGPSSPLNVGVPAAAKTGTTNDYRDNWTLGFTPYLAVGVWAGNSDNSQMRNSSGITGAAPIWSTFMRNVVADLDRRAIVHEARRSFGFDVRTTFERPDGVEEARVCRVASLNNLSSSCPEWETELFIEDMLPVGAREAGPGAGAIPAVPPGEEGAAAAVDPMAAFVTEGDYWAVASAVVVPLPPPPPLPEGVDEEDAPKWPPALLCLPGELGYGWEKAQPVAVLRLPEDEERREWIQEWAAENGWSALEPTAPCTPELVAAALESGSLPGPGGPVSAGGTRAEYRLALAPDSVVSARTVLTGTVVYDPEQISFFKVELGTGRQPTQWITLGDTHQGPVVDGTLEVLDAPSLPPGDYVLRLVLVQSNSDVLQPTYDVPIRIEH